MGDSAWKTDSYGETNPKEFHNLSDQCFRQQLLDELEYCISPETVANDEFLLSLMDPEKYMLISTTTKFRTIRALTTDSNLIREVIRDSKVLELHPDGTRFRSVLNMSGGQASSSQRKTLPIKDAPAVVPNSFSQRMPPWKSKDNSPSGNALAVRRYVLNRLEFFLSPKNLQADNYIKSKFDPEGFILISQLANLTGIKTPTSDMMDMFIDIIRSSHQLQLHPNEKKVRSIYMDSYYQPTKAEAKEFEMPFEIWKLMFAKAQSANTPVYDSPTATSQLTEEEYKLGYCRYLFSCNIPCADFLRGIRTAYPNHGYPTEIKNMILKLKIGFFETSS